jgi:hypothetical protein
MAPHPQPLIEARDREIRRLRNAGWTYRAIALRHGISAERARQIAAVRTADPTMLRGRLAELHAAHHRLRTEMSDVIAAIRELEEEAESARIDRILGLDVGTPVRMTSPTQGKPRSLAATLRGDAPRRHDPARLRRPCDGGRRTRGRGDAVRRLIADGTGGKSPGS